MVSVPKQMLNCCIQRKKARDDARMDKDTERGHRDSESSTSAFTSTKEASPGKSWDSWSDSEEEFFECLSDQGEMEAPTTEESSKRKAEGRLHQHNNMTLLSSSEPLYVPVTQVSVCLSAFYSHSLSHPVCMYTAQKNIRCLYLLLNSMSSWLEFD